MGIASAVPEMPSQSRGFRLEVLTPRIAKPVNPSMTPERKRPLPNLSLFLYLERLSGGSKPADEFPSVTYHRNEHQDVVLRKAS